MSDQKTENGAVEKADQMAWEAPQLRPVFTPARTPEPLPYPCPSWCTHDHFPSNSVRIHMGDPVRVRMDTLYPYEDERGVTRGMTAANLSLRLEKGIRGMEPRVRIDSFWGDDEGDMVRFEAGVLFFDEARELIAVLQHMMKVGMDS